MAPAPSYFDNPEDARIVREQFEGEFQEHRKQYESLSRQIEADGVVAIVRATHFPLFALNDLQGRFPFQSHGWVGGWMAIYQYVNVETARRAPAVRASIQLQSGEGASWTIRRFNAPLSLVHARAQVENTIFDVGAIGPAAEEIEGLLGQLTRLTPESAVLDQLNLGLKAWDEYFQRRFQS